MRYSDGVSIDAADGRSPDRGSGVPVLCEQYQRAKSGGRGERRHGLLCRADESWHNFRARAPWGRRINLCLWVWTHEPRDHTGDLRGWRRLDHQPGNSDAGIGNSRFERRPLRRHSARRTHLTVEYSNTRRDPGGKSAASDSACRRLLASRRFSGDCVAGELTSAVSAHLFRRPSQLSEWPQNVLSRKRFRLTVSAIKCSASCRARHKPLPLPHQVWTARRRREDAKINAEKQNSLFGVLRADLRVFAPPRFYWPSTCTSARLR